MSINFWNGNKSPIRQQYELDVLKAALATTSLSTQEITDDKTDYPKAEDEGNIFNMGSDLLVTVAGNVKFNGRDKIVSNKAITKGLLGYRLLIVKKERLDEFAQVKTAEQMRNYTIGIPATWADADLFRFNQYPVCEKGSYEEVFERLVNEEFDYFALGANEIVDAFNSVNADKLGLAIEPTLMFYYSFPLVFYVNPAKQDLANTLEFGLRTIEDNGQLDDIFNRYYGDIVDKLSLNSRSKITLTNPILPLEMNSFKSSLLD